MGVPGVPMVHRDRMDTWDCHMGQIDIWDCIVDHDVDGPERVGCPPDDTVETKLLAATGC